jgi:hypothetical protein
LIFAQLWTLLLKPISCPLVAQVRAQRAQLTRQLRAWSPFPMTIHGWLDDMSKNCTDFSDRIEGVLDATL